MKWGTERQIIRGLEARLQWFMNEADADEFDSQEVTAIVDLLQIMDPIERREGEFYKTDKAHARFWTFYVFRNSSDEDEPAYPLGMRIEMRLRHFFRSSVVVNGAFILSLVVAMILGGTAVVFAHREGIVQWIKNDESGSISYTSPAVSANYYIENRYTTFEEIPVNYLHLFWIPIGIPEEFELDGISLYDCTNFLFTECQFKDNELFFKISRKEHNNHVVLGNNSVLDGFEILNPEIIEGVEVMIYKKVNSDYTEYSACFCIDNVIYTINSNVEIEDIREIISSNINSL